MCFSPLLQRQFADHVPSSIFVFAVAAGTVRRSYASVLDSQRRGEVACAERHGREQSALRRQLVETAGVCTERLAASLQLDVETAVRSL